MPPVVQQIGDWVIPWFPVWHKPYDFSFASSALFASIKAFIFAISRFSI
jgi:hypothetical protein